MQITVFTVLLAIVIKGSSQISIENVYSNLIGRDSIDQADTFSFFVPKPLGYKGSDPIWPRSYFYGGDIFVDENGATFPLRPQPRRINQMFRSPTENYYERHVKSYSSEEREVHSTKLQKLLRRFTARRS
ncbi:unnamed protein product [Caenorhabditis bovis]|uniref:Uncharacterized protein n=1 Tax=Caenorhabditis bovis TaxID=2654633 RepID=A0A8S1ED79_9PELO|nr:unnamed protein product [Caenorhabditis bovis]